MVGLRLDHISKQKGIRMHATPVAGTRTIARRAMLQRCGLLAGFVVAGCAPLRLLLTTYPDQYDSDAALVEHTLRAFVTTVIPGAPMDDPNAIRIYFDTYYPLHPYRGFFVFDLSQRSRDLYSTARVDQLSDKQQTAVVEHGLASGLHISRLYRGAILLAQVSFYAGIYNDDQGCPLIDFPGANRGFAAHQMYYPHLAATLAQETTRDGNYG
jgi:hypothetical protein